MWAEQASAPSAPRTGPAKRARRLQRLSLVARRTEDEVKGRRNGARIDRVIISLSTRKDATMTLSPPLRRQERPVRGGFPPFPPMSGPVRKRAIRDWEDRNGRICGRWGTRPCGVFAGVVARAIRSHRSDEIYRRSEVSHRQRPEARARGGAHGPRDGLARRPTVRAPCSTDHGMGAGSGSPGEGSSNGPPGIGPGSGMGEGSGVGDGSDGPPGNGAGSPTGPGCSDGIGAAGSSAAAGVSVSLTATC